MLAASSLMAHPAKDRSFIELKPQQCVHLAWKTHTFFFFNQNADMKNRAEQSHFKFVQLPFPAAMP